MCMGKLFTLILNNRLTDYCEQLGIINGAQAGFRKGFSTSGNIFIIHCLINTLFSRKCKLFCAFIDFKGALNNVWRVGLWKTLVDCV